MHNSRTSFHCELNEHCWFWFDLTMRNHHRLCTWGVGPQHYCYWASITCWHTHIYFLSFDDITSFWPYRVHDFQAGHYIASKKKVTIRLAIWRVSHLLKQHPEKGTTWHNHIDIKEKLTISSSGSSKSYLNSKGCHLKQISGTRQIVTGKSHGFLDSDLANCQIVLSSGDTTCKIFPCAFLFKTNRPRT